MSLKAFFVIPLLLLIDVCFSQKVVVNAFMIDKPNSPNADTIYYKKNIALSWDNFKGPAVLNSFAGAVTASGFAYNAGISGDMNLITINVYIYTFFIKSESWRKPFIDDQYHLVHEQHHFDISRLGAQEFYNSLLHNNFSASNYKQRLKDIFNKTYSDNLALQDQYDKETEHSIKNAEQLKWNENISNAVSKLN